jgi:transglutaminase-like putative cysteine protease
MGADVSNQPFFGRYEYTTVYRYTDQVISNDDELRVVPFEDAHTIRGKYEADTNPFSSQVEFEDDFGNTVIRIKVTVPHNELEVVSRGTFKLLPWEDKVADVQLESLSYPEEPSIFAGPSPMVRPSILTQKATEIAGSSTTLLTRVKSIVDWVHDNIAYEKGVTSVNTDAKQVLDQGRGVCQDKVHLALGFLRALEIPCRYVSCILTQQDGDTHAYLEFMHPQMGWLPADPTKGIMLDAGTMYLKLAVGRDYTEASPIKGSFLSRGVGKLSKVYAHVEPDKAY